MVSFGRFFLLDNRNFHAIIALVVREELHH